MHRNGSNSGAERDYKFEIGVSVLVFNATIRTTAGAPFRSGQSRVFYHKDVGLWSTYE